MMTNHRTEPEIYDEERVAPTQLRHSLRESACLPSSSSMVKRVTLDDEFNKNNELKKEELDMLKDWCSKQAHLPPISDELLVLFFHSCYYRMELTKTTIDNYFTCRTHVSDLFEDRNPNKVDMKNGQQVVRSFFLPNTTPEGYKVVFVRFNQTDPSLFSFAQALKSFVMFCDMDAFFNGTYPGFIILFDMMGISFGHFPKLYPMLVKNILYYLQEAMPVRLKGLHFANTVSFMDKILALMKPFMKKELFDVMHLHTDNLDTLHKFVPQKLMPKEYGGDAPPIAELHEKGLKQMQENKWWFEEEEKLRVVESKRSGKSRSDMFGVEGSFKKLVLD